MNKNKFNKSQRKKYILGKLQNSIEGLNSRFIHAEERISDPKDRAFEIIQSEEQENRMKRVKKVYRINGTKLKE